MPKLDAENFVAPLKHPQLEDLLSELTEPNMATIIRETYKDGRRTGSRPEYVASPPLLDQLRDAVFLGLEAGSGSAFGAKLPLAANALDVWNEVEGEAAALYVGLAHHSVGSPREQRSVGLSSQFWECFGDEGPGEPSELTRESLVMFTRLTGRPAHLDPADNIRGWLADLSTDAQKHVAVRIMRRWVARIKGLLKPDPICNLEGTCPVSGATHVIEQGVRKTALYASFGPDGEPEIHSRAARDQVWSGARAIREVGFHLAADRLEQMSEGGSSVVTE